MIDVAILLATYNGSKYIRGQLESFFAQTNQDFTIVIHDDGSSDDTIQIINEFKDRYPDRIDILDGPGTGGPMLNFIYLLSKVEARYYFLCDQDDIWLPQKVEKSLKEVKDAEADFKGKPAIVFTDMYVVDEKLNIIDNSFIQYLGRSAENIAYTQILIDNPASGTTMCFNRQLRDIAVSSPSVQWENVPMHDAWLLEIAAVYGVIRAIKEPLVYYRQTGHNVMGAASETASQKLIRNVSDAPKGFLAKKRSFINEARGFAREILRLKDIPEDKLRVLNAFVHIASKPKLYRMRFYRVNNFTRAHNNLWMRLWV